MIFDGKLLLELLSSQVDLVKEVLRELLARAIPVVAQLVLTGTKPAPLESAGAARDVIAAAILLYRRVARRARLRVGEDPFGRLYLIKDPLAILLAKYRTLALVSVPPSRRQIGTRCEPMPGPRALLAEGEGALATLSTYQVREPSSGI